MLYMAWQQLSWHVQNLVVITSLSFGSKQNDAPIKFWLWVKKLRWNGPLSWHCAEHIWGRCQSGKDCHEPNSRNVFFLSSLSLCVDHGMGQIILVVITGAIMMILFQIIHIDLITVNLQMKVSVNLTYWQKGGHFNIRNHAIIPV